jgi:hypothetical protein
MNLLASEEHLPFVREVTEVVLVSSPARSAIWLTVVASYPCSLNRSTAAYTSRSRAFGSHRPMATS